MKTAILDIETLGLDPFKDRVVAVGIWSEEEESPELMVSEDEKALLEWAWQKISEFELIVGWNIKKFDLWFLKIRSLKHGIKAREIPCLDLMELLFPNGQKWKRLSDVNEFLFGTRMGKENSGRMVSEAFLQKDFQKIEEYLRKDLEITKRIYERAKACFNL